MRWEEFLNHPEVRRWTPEEPAKYLYTKTLHELIATLAVYTHWADMLTAISDDAHSIELFQRAKPALMGSPIPTWYERHLPEVRLLREKLLGLCLFYQPLGEESVPDWEELLQQVLPLIEPVEALYREAMGFPLLPDESAEDVLEWMLRSLEHMHELYEHIRDRDYLWLWSYPDGRISKVKRG